MKQTECSNDFAAKIGYAPHRGKEHHPDDVKIFISGKKNLPFHFKKLLKEGPRSSLLLDV